MDKALMRVAVLGDKVWLEALLLSPECDPLSRDGSGMTALMYAARGGHTSCAKLLLPRSDALAKNDNGTTALMYAARGGHAFCAELLIPLSNSLVTDKYGETASKVARDNGHASLADFIDAYTLAMSEVSEFGSLVSLGATRKKASLRV